MTCVLRKPRPGLSGATCLSQAAVADLMVSRRRAVNGCLQSCIIAAGMVAWLATPPARADLGDELFKLTASDAAAGDNFGFSVAISGNVGLVGSRGNDDAGEASGSAFLFDVTTGNELFKLTASDAAEADNFGWSVAISGNVAIVGSYLDDDAGSAYLFDVTTGDELFKLTASDAAADDHFGFSVAISDNVVIVGSPDDNFGAGSAYLFDVTTGDELFKLTASDAAGEDDFGYDVAISGNIAIVGSPGDEPPGAGGNAFGSAYLFDVTTGDELFKLTASDAATLDNFGHSIAISGNTAIVGAYGDDDAGDTSGSAYLFDVTTGDELFKLTASDAEEDDRIGLAVGISGNTAIAGAPGLTSSSGKAYLFDVISGNELAKLTASDAAVGDQFGFPVDISGSTALVGASFDDDDGEISGSAYLFSAVPEPASVVLLGTAAAGLGVFVTRRRRCA